MRALIFNALLAAPLALFALDSDAECYGNPPAYLGKPCIRSILYGEYFFASVREDGLSYVIRSGNGNPLDGKLIEPSDCWRPGFRIGFGSHLAHDSWEISGDWTYFYSDLIQTVHASFAPPGSTYLTPIFIDADSYSQLLGAKSLQEAKEQWTLSFNAIAFALSRPYYLSRELSVRPQIGFLTAWIDQDVAVSYTTYAPPSGGNGVVDYNTFIQNDTWRAGPFLGGMMDWYIRRKFRFFGSLRAATLYRSLHFSQTQVSVGNSNGDFRLFLKDASHRLQPWMDCQLGLAWGTFFRCSRHYFEAGLQYECQYFWHEFESRVLYQQVANSQDRNVNNLGDLSLQSVALRLRLDF